MRIILLLFISITFGTVGYSQIDSKEIAFNSNWEVGDTFSLEIISSREHFQDKDLFLGDSIFYFVDLEVLDSIDNSFWRNRN